MKEVEMTVDEAAKYFGRSPQAIRWWCVNGTLIAAKCRVQRNRHGTWTIYVPQSSWATKATPLSRTA